MAKILINSELRKENHIFLRTFKYIYHIFLRTFLLNHHIFLRTFRDLNREFCRNLRKKARLRQLLNEKSVVISIKKWDYDRFSWIFSLIRNAYGCDRHDAEVVQCRFPLYLIIYIFSIRIAWCGVFYCLHMRCGHGAPGGPDRHYHDG